ncbi:hypothetical protein ACU686_24290 [Yinghuangia aomiensis]
MSVAACDLDVPSGLDEALDGVDRVFLMSLGHHKATHDTRVVAAARKAGVVRIVQLVLARRRRGRRTGRTTPWRAGTARPRRRCARRGWSGRSCVRAGS